MAKIVNTQRPIKAAATRDSNTIRGHRTDTDSRLGGHWENGKPDFEKSFLKMQRLLLKKTRIQDFSSGFLNHIENSSSISLVSPVGLKVSLDR